MANPVPPIHHRGGTAQPAARSRSDDVVYFIFAIAIVNMGLGFCLAVYLGRQHQASVASGGSWGSAAPGQWTGDTNASFGEAPASPPAEAEGKAEPPAESTPPSAEPASQAPPESMPEEGLGEASVDELLMEVDQYHDQLTQADEELRKSFESPDPDSIADVLGSLMEATDDYLRGRGAAQSKFEELHKDKPELDGIRGDLQEATKRQDEQIERASQSIKAFDYENELETGCREMADETSRLLNASDQLRDTLDEAKAEVARSEHRLGNVDPQQRTDSLTKIANRAGLEADLFEWWEGDPSRSRQLSVALIDIDQLAAVNERYGRKSGDKILQAVARFLQTEGRGVTTMARLSGQQFFLLFPDADVRFTVNAVEQIRQLIETAHFEDGQNDIQLTVTCAVTACTADDSSETLFARAETTLKAAKSAGHNRTFTCEGDEPAPVVPPNFSLSDERIPV